MGAGRAIPVPTQPVPGSHIEHILSLRPYPRPNEGEFQVIHEVSEIGSRIDLRIDPESTQNDLRIDLPETSQTGPEMTLRSSYPGPSDTHGL